MGAGEIWGFWERDARFVFVGVHSSSYALLYPSVFFVRVIVKVSNPKA